MTTTTTMPKAAVKRGLETSSDDEFALTQMIEPAAESSEKAGKVTQGPKGIWDYYDLDPNHDHTKSKSHPRVSDLFKHSDFIVGPIS